MRQTLTWALGGVREAQPLSGRPTLDSLIADLMSKGFAEDAARKAAAALAEAQPGGVSASEPDELTGVSDDRQVEAKDAALRLAYAVVGGRVSVQELADSATAPSDQIRYGELYPSAIQRAKIDQVFLLEDFPILNAVFGYTRGAEKDGPILQAFPAPKGTFRVYGQLAHTEALLFMLEPQAVAAWLVQRHLIESVPETARQTRVLVLKEATVPRPGELVDTPTVGSELLKLVHSYSHRVLRRISAYCGIDRDSLSEYLIPLHMACVVYASASHGDFVLGGLQALFENDLNKALNDVVDGEKRCPLDPSCAKHGSACVACLHVGEPSCRYFNQYLDRTALFGEAGIFSD